MNISFSIEDAVRSRISVRNYKDTEIDQETQQKIRDFIQTLTNPFDKQVCYHFLDDSDLQNKANLGTYGVIKGAQKFIGTTITNEEFALEAIGYELEIVMLYLASLDIGTCWLGGTFNREGFTKAMQVDENSLFPIITPYGYPAPNKHLKEKAMRRIVKADQRKDWKEIFFLNNFDTPLKEIDAKELAFPLEMVRLAPSASNKQPWRVVIIDNACHFFEYKEPGYSDRFDYDIQRIDMGIAAAHFDLATKEKNIQGYFSTDKNLLISLPKHVEYVFSWVTSNK